MEPIEAGIRLKSTIAPQIVSDKGVFKASMQEMAKDANQFSDSMIQSVRKIEAPWSAMEKNRSEAIKERVAKMVAIEKEEKAEIGRMEEIKNKVKQLVVEEKEHQKALAETAKQSEAFKDGLVSLAKTAVAGWLGFQGIVKVIDFFKEARNEAKELSIANLQLKESLGYASAALEEQSEILSKQNLIHNETIIAAQTRLSFYVKDENQLKSLTSAALDYSAATGRDMVSASVLITRAIESEAGRLRELPGHMDGAAGSAERVRSVIELLTNRFHGQAEAVRESKDIFDKMGFAWKEFTERIGVGVFGTVAEQEKLAVKQAREFIDTYTVASDHYRDLIMNASQYAGALKLVEEYEKKASGARAESIKKSREESVAGSDLPSIFPGFKDKGDYTKATSDKAKKQEEEIKRLADLEHQAAQDEIDAGKQREAQRKLDEKRGEESYETKYQIFIKTLQQNKEEADNNDKIIREKASIDDKAKKDELAKEKKHQEDRKRMILSAAETIASQIQTIENNIFTTKMNNAEGEKAERIAMVENSNMSETAKAKKIEQINKESAAKEREIKRQQQDWQVGAAIGSGALAIVKTWSGYAEMGIVGAVLAGIQTALIIGVTATQVAAIKSQKFASGLDAGPVQQRYGGGGTDSEPAMLTPGERVLTPAQYSSITSNSQAHHYDMSITIKGSADAGTVRSIRASQSQQIMALKRTMQAAGRYKQLA